MHVDVGVAIITHEEQGEPATAPEPGLEGAGHDGDVLRPPGGQQVHALVTPTCAPSVAPFERGVQGAEKAVRERRAQGGRLRAAGPGDEPPGGGLGAALRRFGLALGRFGVAPLALLVALGGDQRREAPDVGPPHPVQPGQGRFLLLALVLEPLAVFDDLAAGVGQVADGGPGQLADIAHQPGPAGDFQRVSVIPHAVDPVEGGVVHVEGDRPPGGQRPQIGLRLVDAGQAPLELRHLGAHPVELRPGLAVAGGGVLQVLLQLAPSGRVGVRTFSGQGRGSRGIEAGEQDQRESKASDVHGEVRDANRPTATQQFPLRTGTGESR